MFLCNYWVCVETIQTEMKEEELEDLRPWFITYAIQVDHKNKQRNDNRIENLQPLTSIEHKRKTVREMPPSSRESASRSCGISIRARRAGSQEPWRTFYSQSEAGRRLGVSRSLIQKALCGRVPQAKGWQFEYVPQPNLQGETWREVPAKWFRKKVEGLRVSSEGRFMTKYGKKTRGTNHNGYLMGGGSQMLVHRLVAAAFHEKDLEDRLVKERCEPRDMVCRLQVDHIDGNKANNRATNLQWMSSAEHDAKTKAQKGRKSSAKAASKPVCGRPAGAWVTFDSGADAARRTGCNCGSISKVARGLISRTRSRAPDSEGRRPWWTFRFAPTIQKLEGEEWRPLDRRFFPRVRSTTIRVSSAGRVQTSKGVMTYGSTYAGYCKVEINGHAYKVHRLVCATFHPEMVFEACRRYRELYGPQPKKKKKTTTRP